MVKSYRLAFLFVLCLGTWIPSFAQWETAVKYVYEADYNTLIFIQYTADATPSHVEIDIRQKGSTRILHRKRFSVPTDTRTLSPIRFNLPKGDYLIGLDLDDGQHTYQELGFTCAGKPDAIAASDLFLSYAPIKSLGQAAPILSPVLDEKKTAHFYLEVYSNRYKVLTARAVLYKENRGDAGSQSTTYQSVMQINRILELRRGKVSFSGAFTLATLDEGAYLVEMLIYENDRQIEEKSNRFVIEWKGKQKVLNEINTSIRMMKYIQPESTLNAMLALPTIEAKRIAFLDHWQKLYPGEQDAQMVGYYKKIEAANAQFSGGLPGWMTDRGRVFILYGPAKIDLREIGGKKYERWSYSEWDLTFLFEKRNLEFNLIE